MTIQHDRPAIARAEWFRRRRVWIGALLILGIGIVAAVIYYRYSAERVASGGRSRDGMGGPIPVLVAPATKGNINVYLAGLGTVTPRNMVTVKARVDGQLLRIAFREGQMVSAGDLLAELDPRPFEVLVAQANGQLMRDQALLTNAQVDLDRYKTLLAQDSISKQTLDTQESLVRQYRGAVAVDQGQVDSAKLQLSYARITAPISGRVGLRQVDPGNMIHASDANGMVTITQLQPITVVFSIPEDSLQSVMGRIQEAHALPAEAFDREQKRSLATGKLLTVDNQIDSTTGTVKLKAEFANGDNALFPNQFVNVRMLVDTHQDATLIPSSAIQRGKQSTTFVYVVKGDKTVTVRPIKLGPAEGEITAVEDGLVPGEIVVSDGSDKLRDGSQVEPQSRTAAVSDQSAQRSKSHDGTHRRQRPE